MDLRDHRASPGASHGTAQVMASFFWSGASGMTLPSQISLASTAPVANIFMPEMTTPSSPSRTTRRVGLHVVEGRDRAGRVAKRGVRGDVVHPFAAEVDHPPVTQRLQMLRPGLQHGRLPIPTILQYTLFSADRATSSLVEIVDFQQ